MEFDLEGAEFIQLNKLLKRLSWVESGGHAKYCIGEGDVIVNGEVEKRLRKKLRPGDKVELEENRVVIK